MNIKDLAAGDRFCMKSEAVVQDVFTHIAYNVGNLKGAIVKITPVIPQLRSMYNADAVIELKFDCKGSRNVGNNGVVSVPRDDSFAASIKWTETEVQAGDVK